MTTGDVQQWSAELVLDAGAELGEGPRWDGEAGELVWVDIMVGAVHRFDPETGRDRSFTVGQPVGAANLRRSGGLVLALRDGIAFLDERHPTELRWLAEIECDRPDTRMNDAACDPSGRLWAGTMDLEERNPAGALYRIEPAGAVETILRAVTVSNGIGWSPDGRRLYYVDSSTARLEVFDFEPAAGSVSGRRTVVRIPPDDGAPDGLTVDAEGCIWVALWEGWSIRRYCPDGSLSGSVDVPAGRVTSCAFGGPALDTLYVTTARPDEPDPRQPSAGGIFAVRPGVTGLPTNCFAG
jgi:sugar lactone lactonase YvrE